jgi:hypothetical protein
MNEITWHESAIWFFIAQKLLFANQYVNAEFNIVVLCSIKPHIDQVQV